MKIQKAIGAPGPNKFGEVLKQLRHQQGLTLERVAKMIRSHKGYVSGIESGKVNPPSAKIISQFFRIFEDPFKTLGVGLEDLVELAEVVKSHPLVRARLFRRISDNPILNIRRQSALKAGIPQPPAEPVPAAASAVAEVQ